MAKGGIIWKQTLIKIILALVVLSVLALAAVTPAVKAQQIGCSPDSGSAGTVVTVTGVDFTGSVSVYFGSTASPAVATATSPYAGGYFETTFTVPSGTTPGQYSVYGLDTAGDEGQYPFTVTSGSAPTSTSSSSSSSSSSSTYPYSGSTGSSGSTLPYVLPITTTAPSSAGFWSASTTAGVIAVVAFAIIISAFLLMRNRSERDMLLERERESSPYGSGSTMQARPVEPPRYGQPPYSQSRYGRSSYQSGQLSPYAQRYGSRYSQQSTSYAGTGRAPSPSSYGQQLASSQICPHCKRSIKGDYRVCPYCNKRLR